MIDAAYRYRATVDRVIDGDTYYLRIDLGFRASIVVSVRVRDFDAPEMHGEDHPRGVAAKLAAETFLAMATQIVVVTYKDRQTFARWVADVYLDGLSIVEVMNAAGHVK